MNISKIEAIPVSIPRRTVWQSAAGIFATVNHVIVKVYTDEGITGIGEVAPYGMFSGETQGGACSIIRDYLSPHLKGLDPLNISAVHRKMDEVLVRNSCTKAGIDLAVYDIAGKALNVPVYTLLGGRQRDRIPVGRSLGIRSVEETTEAAQRAVEEGYKMLGLKIGPDPKTALITLEAVRATVGPEVPILVDANAGFASYDAAVKVLKSMERFDLALIEQPLKGHDLAGMARLCTDLVTPILADESLMSVQDAVTITRHRAADALNVKVIKVGGLLQALKVAAVAEGAGLGLYVGSMFDTGIGAAASAHFAASQPFLAYPCSLATVLSLSEDLLAEELRIEEGYAYVPEGPGLGIKLDERRLRKYRCD